MVVIVYFCGIDYGCVGVNISLNGFDFFCVGCSWIVYVLSIKFDCWYCFVVKM